MLPNYSGGSLVNLVASIVQARGGEPRHPVLAALPAAELSEAENIVLVIIDGLGDHYLARRGAGGELARRRRASITSVFPSTTASAITTSYTGRTPLEHGLTGWFTYFGAAGCVASPLQFRSRGENLPLQQRGFSPGSAFPAPSVFESLPVRSIAVAPEEPLELPAELAAMLRFPLCGERRVAYCYVHSPAQFMDRARHWLGDRADVRPSRELLREGWFGPGTPHPRIDERVGDVALVMRGRYTVKGWTPGEPRHLHIGNHGGTSEYEMMIPLIVETT